MMQPAALALLAASHLISSLLLFKVAAGATIHSVHPIVGSHAGGTLVTIEGAGFAYAGMEGELSPRHPTSKHTLLEFIF